MINVPCTPCYNDFLYFYHVCLKFNLIYHELLTYVRTYVRFFGYHCGLIDWND